MNTQHILFLCVMLAWLIIMILVALYHIDKYTEKDRKWREKQIKGKTYYYPKQDKP